MHTMDMGSRVCKVIVDVGMLTSADIDCSSCKLLVAPPIPYTRFPTTTTTMLMGNPVFSNHLSVASDARLRFLFSSFPANKYMLKFNKRNVTVHQKDVSSQRH